MVGPALQTRVLVFWEADTAFYPGVVTAISGDETTVTHDDGDVMKYNFAEEVWFEEVRVGSRIRVFWPADAKFYGGEVTRPSGDKCTVLHDDDERQTYRLTDEVYFVEASGVHYDGRFATGYKCVCYREAQSKAMPYRLRLQSEPWNDTRGFATANEAAAYYAVHHASAPPVAPMLKPDPEASEPPPPAAPVAKPPAPSPKPKPLEPPAPAAKPKRLEPHSPAAKPKRLEEPHSPAAKAKPLVPSPPAAKAKPLEPPPPASSVGCLCGDHPRGVLGCLLLFGHGGKCIVPSAAASAGAGKRPRSGLPEPLEGERRPDKAPTRDTAKDPARADARSGSKGSAAPAGKKGEGKGEGKGEAAADEATCTLPPSRAVVTTSLVTSTLSPASQSSSQSSMQSSMQSSGQSAGSFQLKARGRLVALEATLWASSQRRPPCTVSELFGTGGGR